MGYGSVRDPQLANIVTICGSMKFADAMQRCATDLTLKGKLVFMPHVLKDAQLTAEQIAHEGNNAEFLDQLHRQKIDHSFEIMVVTVGGYVGESTRAEIAYAASVGKAVNWWAEEPVQEVSNFDHGIGSRAKN